MNGEFRIVLVLALIAGLLCGCSPKEDGGTPRSTDAEIQESIDRASSAFKPPPNNDPLAFLSPAPAPPTVEHAFVNDRFYDRSGTLVATNERDHYEIRIGSQRYRLNFDGLPVYRSDCEDSTDPKVCLKTEGTCTECIYESRIVAFDEPRSRLFLTVSTGKSKNKRMVLLAYDLPSGNSTRYGTFVTAGLAYIGFSNSGRYLSYVEYWTCGVCCTSSGLGVIDLQEKRIGTLPRGSRPDKPRPTNISAVKWLDESALEYEVVEHDMEECDKHPDTYEKKTFKRRLTLSELEYTGLEFPQ